MTSRFEVKLSPDGRLLLVVHYAEDTNFWVQPDGTYTHVPTEREIELLKKAYEAVDGFNKEQMFRKNIKPSD